MAQEKANGHLQFSMSPFEKIKTAFTQMVIFRQATLDKQTFSLYCKRLAKERCDDVIAALETLQEKPREQHELALPEIGTLLGMVREAARKRYNRAQLTQKTFLVRWQCPTCNGTCCGWRAPDNHDAPHCGRHLAEGYDCGAEMLEIYRETA